MSGEMILNAMKPMHDRSNGLGGGFAAYGIYPEYRDFYALHMFFNERATRKSCEVFLKERFEIVKSEIVPTRKIPEITDEPIIWRYFVSPLQSVLASIEGSLSMHDFRVSPSPEGRTLLFDVAAPFGYAGDDSTLSERIAAAVSDAIPGCRAVVTVDRAEPDPKGDAR